MSDTEAFKNGDPGYKLPQVYIGDVKPGEAYTYNLQTKEGLYRAYYTMIIVRSVATNADTSRGRHFGTIAAVDTVTQEEIIIKSDDLGYVKMAPIVIKLEGDEVPLVFCVDAA